MYAMREDNGPATIAFTVIAILVMFIIGLLSRGDNDLHCVGGWDTRECYDKEPRQPEYDDR